MIIYHTRVPMLNHIIVHNCYQKNNCVFIAQRHSAGDDELVD